MKRRAENERKAEVVQVVCEPFLCVETHMHIQTWKLDTPEHKSLGDPLTNHCSSLLHEVENNSNNSPLMASTLEDS